MKISRLTLLHIIIILSFSGFTAYSFALRFTHFFLSSRVDKILLFGSIFIFFAVINLLVLTPAINKLIVGISKKVFLAVLLASTILTGIILLSTFRFPIFPKLMSVEIRPKLGDMDPRSGQSITISSMTRYDPPRNLPTPINLTDLMYEGGWHPQGDSLEFSDSFNHSSSVRYTSYVQGYIIVEFITGPGQGEVELNFNEEVMNLDLSGTTTGTIDYKLAIPNTWDNADRLRKIMLSTGFLSDSISIFLLCLITLIFCYQALIKKRLKIRGLAALAGVLLISIPMVFIANQIQKEVVFTDPVLEESIRSVVNKPEGSIKSHQLLTIIELDLSGRNIQRIDGIEALRNLRVLDLSNNQLTDIQPLGKLKKLQKLNLRENQVTNIAPLGGLRNLMYLNLHSNPGISDASPLRNLTRLEKLILRNIPIGDQTAVFDRMTRLTYLNVRNCSIENMEFLAILMKNGALQDHQGFEVFATVNLLENPIVRDGSDPYEQVRPFWHKITYRYPYQLPYYSNGITEPVFSHDEGFYEDDFSLYLSSHEMGGRIFYTLDGSEPTVDENLKPFSTTYEFTTPISINNRASEPNVLSNIETSKLWSYYPPSPVFKGTVIRAMVVDAENRRSRIITKSFFVDENMKERYTFPVLSIVTSPDGFFDNKIGIYVPGDLYRDDQQEYKVYNTANYTQRGREWERPASIELFSTDGKVLLNQEIGIRVNGNASRANQQKSLRLIARSEYENNDLITYDFFPQITNRANGTSNNTFQTIILRSGFTDIFIQSLLEDTGLDIQGAMPVQVFLDGEYWGVYNIRTRYDEHYFQQYHDVSKEQLIVCKNEGALQIGDNSDKNTCNELFQFIDKNYIENRYATPDTLSNPEMYKEIGLLMDTDNLIDYYISHIYADNNDRDYYYWKYKGDSTSLFASEQNTKDGKWRWVIIDMDRGFINPGRFTLKLVTTEGSMETYLLRAMLESNEFKRDFINRFADMLNTNFNEDFVLSRIDQMESQYSPEMLENIHRWELDYRSLEDWYSYIDRLREFALLRPNVQRDHIMSFFDLPGTAQLTLKTDPEKGYVKINSINIIKSTPNVRNPQNWSGIYFQGVPITITAIPAEGYRFSHWEGLPEGQATEAEQELDLAGDLVLKAVFTQ